jgi:hypothetical protein
MAWDDSDTSESDVEHNDVVSVAQTAGSGVTKQKLLLPKLKFTKVQMNANIVVEKEARKETTKKAKAAAMAGRGTSVILKKKKLICEVFKKFGICAKGNTCRFLHEKPTQPTPEPGWKSEERPSDGLSLHEKDRELRAKRAELSTHRLQLLTESCPFSL